MYPGNLCTTDVLACTCNNERHSTVGWLSIHAEVCFSELIGSTIIATFVITIVLIVPRQKVQLLWFSLRSVIWIYEVILHHW